MARGKESVKKGIWYLGKKKRKIRTRIKKRQQGNGFPIGLIAPAAAPLLGEIEKPIFKTIFGRGRRKRWWEKKYCYDDDRLFQKKLHYQTDKPSTQSRKKRPDEIYQGTLS